MAKPTSAAREARIRVIRYERHGNAGFLGIDNPPVNASSVEVRQGLLDGLKTLCQDPALRDIVIIGDGNTFVAGSDIREFDAPIQSPSLPEVILAIEAVSVPVIAAIHGAALGSGFELALGCDGRIAVTESVVGLHEVSLGMVPAPAARNAWPTSPGSECDRDRDVVPQDDRAAVAEAWIDRSVGRG